MTGCDICGHIWDNCECDNLSHDEAKDLGSHYRNGSIEPIDVIKDMGLEKGFYVGNIIKYVMRHDHKGTPKKDLNKAMDYLKMLIDSTEEDK